MTCDSCGSEDIQANGICRRCGASSGPDEYAPPMSVDMDASYDGYGMEPWEFKKWRISGISWAAIMLSCFVPPVGLIVGFFAVAYANKHRNRPGNKAMAIASIATAFYMGFMILYVGWLVWAQSDKYSYLDDPYYYTPPPDYLSDPLAQPTPAEDPWTNPADMEELQKLLEQMQNEGKLDPSP